MKPDHYETWMSKMNNKTEGRYVRIFNCHFLIYPLFSLFISSIFSVRLRREIISRRASFVASKLSVLAPRDLCVAMEMMETSTQYHGRLGGSLCSINDHHMALGQLSKGNSSEDTSSGKWTMQTSFTSSLQAFPSYISSAYLYSTLLWASKGDNRFICRIREISSSLLSQEEYIIYRVSRSLRNLFHEVLTVI